MDNLIIELELYSNQRIAFRLTCADGEPYGALTTNIVEAEIAEDEICIPIWNLPPAIVDSYLASGRFQDTGMAVATGYVVAPIWRVICSEFLAKAKQLRAK